MNNGAIPIAMAAIIGCCQVRSVDAASGWRYSVGPSYRSGAEVSTDGQCYSDASLIPDYARTGFSGSAAEFGSTAATDNHEYDDGYVRPIVTTVDTGQTYYWGYDSADQVQDGYLVFTATDRLFTEFSRVTTSGDGLRKEDAAWGVQAEAEYCVSQGESLNLGLLMTFSRHSFSYGYSGTTFRDQQEWQTYQLYIEDSYYLGGRTPPGAPYALDISTEPTPSNPLDKSWYLWMIRNRLTWIDASPSRDVQSVLAESHRYDAWNIFQQSLSLDVYVFSIGPSAEWDGDFFSLSCAVGPTLSVVQSDATYQEMLYGQLDGGVVETIAHWREREDDDHAAVGGFIQFRGGAHIPGSPLEVHAFSRYDWVQPVEGKVGPSSWKADLDGASAGLMLSVSLW